MKIRPVEARDRGVILEIVQNVGNFSEVEIQVAMDLVDDGIEKYSSGDYIVCVIEDDSNEVQGFGCYGETPLTQGTYDFYWMAIHPRVQGHGLGREILQFVEEDVRTRAGRLLVLETSSQENYQRTRIFYERSGYELIARIRDFYKPNDDKMIYVKYL